MESFLSRYKNILVLIIVLLVQVIGLAVQVRRPVSGVADFAQEAPQVRLIRYWVVSLISPPERLLRSMGGGVRAMWSNYVALRGVRQQNASLKAEVDRLRMEQAGLLEDARQGQRLQQLLSFKEHYIYKTQPAQVIGTSGSDLSHVLDLNKGSRDGIKLDMPVITPDGIVGKIKEVFPHTSRLLVISDQTSGAGVLMESLRIRGVLRGNVLGQPEIVNITRDERIKPGERILTSGGDGVYPRGLPVGVVERTIPDPEHDGYIAVIVTPAANLARLEEVLVITEIGEKLPAAEQQDIAQSVVEADAQKRAADILSERLPGLKDPNAPAAAADAPAAPLAEGDPGRPPKPGVALRPDRFSPNKIAPVSTVTPGQIARPVLPRGDGMGAPVSRPVVRTPQGAAETAITGVARTGTASSATRSGTASSATGASGSPAGASASPANGTARPRPAQGSAPQGSVGQGSVRPGVGGQGTAGQRSGGTLAGGQGTKPAQTPTGASSTTTTPRKPRAVTPDGAGTQSVPVKPPAPQTTKPKPQSDTTPPGGRL